MPAMPRVNDKFRKIAYRILGKPENEKKQVSYCAENSPQDKSGLDDLVNIGRIIPRNYF